MGLLSVKIRKRITSDSRLNLHRLGTLVCLALLPLVSAADIKTLNECLSVLEQSPAVMAARLGTDVGQAAIMQAQARPNAQLSAFSNPTYKNRSPFSKADAMLRLDQTVERGDKYGLRVKSAQWLKRASDYDLMDAVRYTTLAVSTTYVDFKAAYARAELLGQAAENASRLAQAADIRVKAGDLARIEAGRIRSEAIRAQAEAAQAKLEANLARQLLATQLGISTEASSQWTPQPDWPLQDLSSDVPPSAFMRPDVAAANARYLASQSTAELAKAQRTRDVTLSAQLERAPDLGGTVVGVGVGIPLFTGNDFSGDIARSNAESQLFQAEFNRLTLLQQQDLVASQNNQATALQRLVYIQNELIPLVTENAEKLELAYRKGGASLSDFLDARRQAASAMLELITAQSDLAKARALVKAATTSAPTLPNP